MSACRHEQNGILYYTSSLLDSFSVPHLFAGRHGGVSAGSGAFSSLNVSQSRADADGKRDSTENVAENCRRALSLLERTPATCAMMNQIHSDAVLTAREAESISACFAFGKKIPDCDGLIAKKGEKIDTLGVKTADCVPILLYDVKNDIAAALHAGWRGTTAGIAEKAVRKMRAAADSADSRIVAAIGPRIGACCYEVNDAVYDACRSLSEREREACFPCAYVRGGEQKYRADLGEINRVFLLRAGISAEDIDLLPLCTRCLEKDFFSHRASHGFSGTQISLIGCR